MEASAQSSDVGVKEQGSEYGQMSQIEYFEDEPVEIMSNEAEEEYEELVGYPTATAFEEVYEGEEYTEGYTEDADRVEEEEGDEHVTEEWQEMRSGIGTERVPNFICEDCGEHLRGSLKYRKHKFQVHQINLPKRFRDVDKTLSKIKQSGMTKILADEEEILMRSWTQKKRQKMRNSGEAYISNAAVLVDKRRVQPVNCKCMHKCNEHFTEEEREALHKHYWSMVNRNRLGNCGDWRRCN